MSALQAIAQDAAVQTGPAQSSHRLVPSYRDAEYDRLERELDALTAAGSTREELASLIEKHYSLRNRKIRNVSFSRLDPASVADDYLFPRKDLNRFTVENWIRRIFLDGLKPRIVDAMFFFGLGRLFSSYNDLGVQHATDVDINIIVDDGLSVTDIATLSNALVELRTELHRRFGIVLDMHPDYTVRRESEVLAELGHADGKRRFAAVLFYRTNERSIRILKDNPEIREKVFAPIRKLPDAVLFEHFLGFGSGKATFSKIRTDAEPLSIGMDGTCERANVSTVIGSKAFGLYCRRHFPLGLFVAPPEWFFSMKYFVNRVYDYACAMRMHGHSLESIGFNAPGARDGVDPDFRFLRNAHKLMLHLQELIQARIGAYGFEVDYSWISGPRFQRLIEIGGDGFRNDFDAMVLEGNLLMPSEALRYRALRDQIKSHANDRYMEGNAKDWSRFPQGIHYETIYRDSERYRIQVPYAWADLGFFAFSAIGTRIAKIVEGKLLPALPSMGMPTADFRRYAQALGSSTQN